MEYFWRVHNTHSPCTSRDKISEVKDRLPFSSPFSPPPFPFSPRIRAIFCDPVPSFRKAGDFRLFFVRFTEAAWGRFSGLSMQRIRKLVFCFLRLAFSRVRRERALLSLFLFPAMRASTRSWDFVHASPPNLRLSFLPGLACPHVLFFFRADDREP